MTDLDAFITGLPKAELHLHIEGSLEPELMVELARRNQVEIPFASVEEVRAAYSFTRLQDFLDIYYAGANVLREQRDFHDLAAAYFARAHADGVVHAEIFFDPQTHTDRGIAFGTVIEGLLSAMVEAEAAYGMTSKLILCFLRHLDEEAAFATLAAAEPWLDRLAGVGLDSSELGHPPEKFARVFAAGTPPPNIIFILADDLGYGELGCYGQKEIQTPNIDRLAAEGMRFTQFYAGNTVCAPSRSVLMTGLHMGHTRVRGNAGGGAPAAQMLGADDITVARVLHDAGYTTGLVGKWGLGGPNDEGDPRRRGSKSRCRRERRGGNDQNMGNARTPHSPDVSRQPRSPMLDGGGGGGAAGIGTALAW